MSMILIKVNTETVAVMGATLANGGICPTTGQKVRKDDNDVMDDVIGHNYHDDDDGNSVGDNDGDCIDNVLMMHL